MPTYVLEGGGRARLPRKPLTLRVQGRSTPGADGGQPRLAAFRDGYPDHTAITPMPGMLVLPRVEGDTVVRVLPESGKTFGSASVLSLSAAIEIHGDTDPERAVMSSIDVSGLNSRDLVTVSPCDGELEVVAMGLVADVPLPELASKARDLARELLGTERVPDELTVGLDLVVDTSASMRPYVLDGSVAAVVEVVAGVSRVVSGDHDLTATLSSARSTPLPPTAPDALPQVVHDALVAAPMTTGFRSVTAKAGDSSISCVISDSIPADLAEERTQLLALLPDSTAAVLGPRLPRSSTPVPVGEWGGDSAYVLLNTDPQLLRRVVASLLAGLLGEDAGSRYPALQQRPGGTR